ncbi:MAG: hypothetical protein ACI81O_001429, partial [Cyclobacteriaceae bacterium]
RDGYGAAEPSQTYILDDCHGKNIVAKGWS